MTGRLLGFLLVGALAAASAGCGAAAQQQQHDVDAQPEVARIQAAVAQLPGVTGATLKYSDGGINGADLYATLLVQRGDADQAHADEYTTELTRLVWLSQIRPLGALSVTTGAPGSGIPSILTTVDLTSGAAGSLTARFGPRPSPSPS